MEDRNQEKKEKKVENLINIVEKHTRTERHLEQYSHIGDPKYKEEAREKQQVREKQIDELKNQIVGKENTNPSPKEEIDNIKENYKYGQGYIESNAEHMNPSDLKNLEKRQENRKIQLENLENNWKEND